MKSTDNNRILACDIALDRCHKCRCLCSLQDTNHIYSHILVLFKAKLIYL